jgi:hypothetical protein
MRCANGFLQGLVGGVGGGGRRGGWNTLIQRHFSTILYMYINALYLHFTIGDSSPTDTETGQNDFSGLEPD